MTNKLSKIEKDLSPIILSLKEQSFEFNYQYQHYIKECLESSKIDNKYKFIHGLSNFNKRANYKNPYIEIYSEKHIDIKAIEADLNLIIEYLRYDGFKTFITKYWRKKGLGMEYNLINDDYNPDRVDNYIKLQILI